MISGGDGLEGPAMEIGELFRGAPQYDGRGQGSQNLNPGEIPARSGSAPPVVQGPVVPGMVGLFGRQTFMPGSKGEELMRYHNQGGAGVSVDSVYAQLYCNDKLNPRPRESSRGMAVRGDAIDSSLFAGPPLLPTHVEEPEISEDELLETLNRRNRRVNVQDWSGGGSNSLFSLGLGPRPKSLVDLIQEDFPRTPSPIFTHTRAGAVRSGEDPDLPESNLGGLRAENDALVQAPAYSLALHAGRMNPPQPLMPRISSPGPRSQQGPSNPSKVDLHTRHSPSDAVADVALAIQRMELQEREREAEGVGGGGGPPTVEELQNQLVAYQVYQQQQEQQQVQAQAQAQVRGYGLHSTTAYPHHPSSYLPLDSGPGYRTATLPVRYDPSPPPTPPPQLHSHLAAQQVAAAAAGPNMYAVAAAMYYQNMAAAAAMYPQYSYPMMPPMMPPGYGAASPIPPHFDTAAAAAAVASAGMGGPRSSMPYRGTADPMYAAIMHRMAENRGFPATQGGGAEGGGYGGSSESKIGTGGVYTRSSSMGSISGTIGSSSRFYGDLQGQQGGYPAAAGGASRGGEGRSGRLTPAPGAGGGGRGEEGSAGGGSEGRASSLLEEFKSNKTRRFELADIEGHVAEFSGDQHGSRFIQQKLESASEEEKEGVFQEVQPRALALMTDVFGNYVIQKFFEYGTVAQRRDVAKQLVGHVLPLSLQMYGCRVIQKALEVVEVDQQAQLVGELDGHVMRCVRDQNGNHVVQKCIECVPAPRIQFIIQAFQGQVVPLSTHPYGCRVIQRVLEHCMGNPQNHAIMAEILCNTCTLAQDQYGNYVVQHVLEHGSSEERREIITKLAGQIVAMSQHKFASNVVEKCLEHGGPKERQILLHEMLGLTDENEPLQAMMKDQFANYVVQKVLETCNDQQRDMLLGRIRVHLHALKKYTYGKHIVARVEKLVAAGGRMQARSEHAREREQAAQREKERLHALGGGGGGLQVEVGKENGFGAGGVGVGEKVEEEEE